MANDLYAAPSAQELKEVNDSLYAAPTAEELSALTPHHSIAAEPIEPGQLEALLRGTAQGATLGFADEATGGLQALLALAEGKDFGEAYRKNRDESRHNYKAAEEAHPLTSMAGNVVGGLGTLAIPGLGMLNVGKGAAGAGAAARMGAAGLEGLGLGAIGGVGGGESEDALGMGKEALTGGISGALLGGALSGAASGLKASTKLPGVNKLSTALTEGLEGNNLISGEGRKAIFDKQVANLAEMKGVTKGAQRAAGEAMEAAKKAATEEVPVQVIEKYADAVKAAMAKTSRADQRAEYGKILGTIETFLDENAGAQKGLVSPEDFLNLKRDLGDFGNATDAFGDAINNFSKRTKTVGSRIVSEAKDEAGKARPLSAYEQELGLTNDILPMKSVLGEVAPGLNEASERFAGAAKAEELIPEAKLLYDASKTNVSGYEAQDQIAKLQQMAKSNPDLAGMTEMFPTMEKLAKAEAISKDIASSTIGHSLLGEVAGTGGTIKGMALAGSNMAGLGVNAVKQGVKSGLNSVAEGVASKTMPLFQKAPAELQDIAVKLGQHSTDLGRKLGDMLSKVATQDNAKRNAMLFAIQQNPAYRELINSVK